MPLNLLFVWDSNGQFVHVIEQEFTRITKLFRSTMQQADSDGFRYAMYRDAPSEGGFAVFPPIYSEEIK